MIRKVLYRIGRRIYAAARGDLPNKPETNGEHWLIDQVMARAPERAIFVDIGANVGDWSACVIKCAAEHNKNIHIKAFEPCAGTRQPLLQRFADNPEVQIYDTALSNEPGNAVLFSNKAGSGTNSLNSVSGQNQEAVQVSTLDAFVAANKISHIQLAKIDTEGFDALVLIGASQNLAAGTFEIVQFEYNWRWLVNSQSLRNVFNIIENTPYKLGKLAGTKILIFDKWHFEMERYFENNYVLVKDNGLFSALGIKAHYDDSNVLCY